MSFKQKVIQQKKAFVEESLTPLLRRIDPAIERAEYEITENDTELVHVLYVNSSGEICANVTCDSLLALTRDVLKKL